MVVVVKASSQSLDADCRGLRAKFFLRERPFQTLCFYRCGGFTLKIQHLVFIYECDVWQVCCDDTLGRHLVATRDIKQGEVVLREAPLLQGPSQVTGPVCLGCLQGISQHNSEPCDKCGWPLCRRTSCRDAPQHLPECRWTVDKRATPVSYTHCFSCRLLFKNVYVIWDFFEYLFFCL